MDAQSDSASQTFFSRRVISYFLNGRMSLPEMPVPNRYLYSLSGMPAYDFEWCAIIKKA